MKKAVRIVSLLLAVLLLFGCSNGINTETTAPENSGAVFPEGDTMYCTITDIRGDYAFVKYEDTGVISEVAIALLPFGVDVGDRLKFENYEFTLA